MKSLYYRAERIRSRTLAAVAIASIAITASIERFPSQNRGPREETMLAAARRTDAAFQIIRQRRIESGHRIFAQHDPADSGLLGPSMSMVTSLPGHLDAKQTSANPNFAAVAVDYLLAAGARPGDRVAIGCTGSFPALNIAALAAAESMGLEVSLVSSASSSQYGANDPQCMWPEMERCLNEEEILSTRSLAVSRGGFRDMAAGMTDQTRQLLDTAIARGGQPILNCQSLEDSIDRRLELYTDDGHGVGHYAAYVNVGGGSASIGGTNGNDQMGRGLIWPSKRRVGELSIDSVAKRFLAADVPVVNLIEVVALAKQHGLPVAPTERPKVGEGKLYSPQPQRRSLALVGIMLILAVTTLMVRPPVWCTRLGAFFHHPSATIDSPRWMV